MNQSIAKISTIRRHLIIKIVDDYPPLLPVMHHFHNHYLKCDQILGWMLANNLKGKKLFEWIKIENGGSLLLTGSKILKKINKEKNNMPIILGKDFT